MTVAELSPVFNDAVRLYGVVMVAVLAVGIAWVLRSWPDDDVDQVDDVASTFPTWDEDAVAADLFDFSERVA